MFKNLTKKRLTVLLVSLSLILVVGVGVTLAYVFASTGNVVNTFTPSHVSCAVVENNSATENTGNIAYTGDLKSNVMIKNTGDTEAYIRVAVIFTLKNATTGNVLAISPDKLNTCYSIDWSDNFDGQNNAEQTWVKLESDGFYYYKKPVQPGYFTDPLISSWTPIPANIPEGYVLSVEIVASAIQSTPANVVGDNWSNSQVTVGVDAKTRHLTFTNKQGGTQ